MNLSATGVLNRYINRGNEYMHTYTGFIRQYQLEAMYKNWTLSASANPSSRYLFSETLSQTAASADINLSYRPKKNLRLGTGIMNPFFKNGEYNYQRHLSAIAPKETWNYTKDMSNVVYLTCSWTATVGKKRQVKMKQFYNSDSETGIVK